MNLRTFFLFTLIIPIMSCVSFGPAYEFSDVFSGAKINLRHDDEYDFKEVNQTDQTLKTGINLDPKSSSYASSSDGVLVISWFEQYYRVRNLMDGSLSEIIDFGEEIFTIDVAPDHSSYMVSGESYIQERDTLSHKALRQAKRFHPSQFDDFEYAESGNLFILYSSWGMTLWDLSSGKYIKRISKGISNIYLPSTIEFHESSNQLLVNFVPFRDREKGSDGKYYSSKMNQIYTVVIDISTGFKKAHTEAQLPVERVYEMSTVFSITGDRALNIVRAKSKGDYLRSHYFIYCISTQTGEILWIG